MIFSYCAFVNFVIFLPIRLCLIIVYLFCYCLLLLLLCAFPVALCIFGAYFEASLVKTVTGAVMRWRTVYTRMQLALLIDSWSWILK